MFNGLLWSLYVTLVENLFTAYLRGIQRFFTAKVAYPPNHLYLCQDNYMYITALMVI